jgi:hypothetical protein
LCGSINVRLLVRRVLGAFQSSIVGLDERLGETIKRARQGTEVCHNARFYLSFSRGTKLETETIFMVLDMM